MQIIGHDGKPFMPTDKIVNNCHKFFGMLPGQRLAEFGNEIKALSDKDKEQLQNGFVNGTLTY